MLPTGCDPEILTAANVAKCLSRKEMVFTVPLYGTANLPQALWEASVNTLYRYLDGDEDGVTDDPNLIASLQPTLETLGFAVLECPGAIELWGLGHPLAHELLEPLHLGLHLRL